MSYILLYQMLNVYALQSNFYLLYCLNSLSSLRMYNKMWHQTQEALNSLLDKESQLLEPQRNQVFIFQTLATYYIKYVQIDHMGSAAERSFVNCWQVFCNTPDIRPEDR